MSMHAFVRFEPLPGKADALREELLKVNAPSRLESGCISLYVYESLREPKRFEVHSEWVDEAAFELHATLPHTLYFLEAVKSLLPHPVEGWRTHSIGGGPGAASRST